MNFCSKSKLCTLALALLLRNANLYNCFRLNNGKLIPQTLKWFRKIMKALLISTLSMLSLAATAATNGYQGNLSSEVYQTKYDQLLEAFNLRGKAISMDQMLGAYSGRCFEESLSTAYSSLFVGTKMTSTQPPKNDAGPLFPETKPKYQLDEYYEVSVVPDGDSQLSRMYDNYDKLTERQAQALVNKSKQLQRNERLKIGYDSALTWRSFYFDKELAMPEFSPDIHTFEAKSYDKYILIKDTNQKVNKICYYFVKLK